MPSSWAWKSSQTFWTQFMSPPSTPSPISSRIWVWGHLSSFCAGFCQKSSIRSRDAQERRESENLSPPGVPSNWSTAPGAGMNCGKVRICFCLGEQEPKLKLVNCHPILLQFGKSRSRKSQQNLEKEIEEIPQNELIQLNWPWDRIGDFLVIPSCQENRLPCSQEERQPECHPPTWKHFLGSTQLSASCYTGQSQGTSGSFYSLERHHSTCKRGFFTPGWGEWLPTHTGQG